MKLLQAAGLLALLPLLGLAQTTPPPDSSTKAKPNSPIIASEHAGLGRIGVRLIFDKETGLPQISALIRGGPAADTGLLVGDYIVKVDKNYTTTLTNDEVRLALHGQPGSGVELTVERGDNPKLLVVAVERRIIPGYSEDTLDSALPPAEEKP